MAQLNARRSAHYNRLYTLTLGADWLLSNTCLISQLFIFIRSHSCLTCPTIPKDIIAHQVAGTVPIPGYPTT
jgi:hypothetical protein